MSPLEAQIILEELRKLHTRFDEFDTQIERCFLRTLSALERQGDAVELRVGGSERATQVVVANNSGGIFDGDGDSATASGDALVVADNWGGLFVEDPSFIPEPVPAPNV